MQRHEYNLWSRTYFKYEPDNTEENEASCLCFIEPSFYEEARSVTEAQDWKNAMDDEFLISKQRDIFPTVKRQNNKRILDCGWV